MAALVFLNALAVGAFAALKCLSTASCTEGRSPIGCDSYDP
ncbi:hypothetical protein AG0111_0g4384 [Alternaria gaisen]|uniref:Uncharacterized protein n=1 Tax=Alternaria gaisen TaxID=167740 RepID=A0ACB6FS83_9PLEO|nr:hypothetical protein AG0111_0g4384 [Alternaria gaisen]